jgi:hypothetical protein
MASEEAEISASTVTAAFRMRFPSGSTFEVIDFPASGEARAMTSGSESCHDDEL